MVVISVGLSCSARDGGSTGAPAALDDRPRTDAQAFAELEPLGLGAAHTCVLARRGVKCWGNIAQPVPALSHPQYLTSGSGYSCAVDDHGVTCWGSNVLHETTVPALRHPTQISAKDKTTCAVVTEGVACWGGFNPLPVPVLNRPTEVRAGSRHFCALDADGVKCWGANNFGRATVPTLRGPTRISVGYVYSRRRRTSAYCGSNSTTTGRALAPRAAFAAGAGIVRVSSATATAKTVGTRSPRSRASSRRSASSA